MFSVCSFACLFVCLFVFVFVVVVVVVTWYRLLLVVDDVDVCC